MENAFIDSDISGIIKTSSTKTLSHFYRIQNQGKKKITPLITKENDTNDRGLQ